MVWSSLSSPLCCRRQISEEDVLSHLSGLQLGDIKVVTFRDCPAPVNPLSVRLTTLGVLDLEMVQVLEYINIPPSYGSSQPQFEGRCRSSNLGFAVTCHSQVSISKICLVWRYSDFRVLA